MDKETFASLGRLLAYCYEEEKDNYEANPSKIHIFHDLQRLNEWAIEEANKWNWEVPISGSVKEE
jgi:hypothetical protein